MPLDTLERAYKAIFEQMGEASPMGLFTTDETGRATYVNPRLAEIFGVEREQMMGPAWAERIHPEDRESVSEEIAAARREDRESVMEYRLVRPDGTLRWARAHVAPMHDCAGGLLGYGGSVEDVTDRRQAELERLHLLKQLDEQRRQISDLLESLPAIVWESRGRTFTDLKLTYVSAYAQTLLGVPIRELLASENVGPRLTHPDDHEVVAAGIRRAVRGEPARYEFRVVARDGSVFWLEARANPILDADGSVVGTRGVALDITARKQAEEAMRRGEQSQREFVTNVSHDFRTPLASIKGYAETLLRGASADSAVSRRFTRTILKNAERLTDLVEDILTVSSLESGAAAPEPETISLAAFAQSLAEDLEPVLRAKSLSCRVAVSSTLRVRADRGHLSQILDNLVANAARYNRRGGWIRVSARRVTSDGRRFVEVCVADGGVGISAEHLPRVFERFYRVDRVRSAASQASGLGLHIVKRLVEAAGGRVWAESAQWRGARFYFTAPAA